MSELTLAINGLNLVLQIVILVNSVRISRQMRGMERKLTELRANREITVSLPTGKEATSKVADTIVSAINAQVLRCGGVIRK